MSVDHISKAKSLYTTITKEFSAQSTKTYNHDKLDLYQLDNWKNEELPDILLARYNELKHVWLTKDELVLLMDWKLAKGKFRPTLPKLIKSNEEKTVESVTKEGLDILINYFNQERLTSWKKVDTTTYKDVVKKAFKKLCELRGVGPATASLIMSLLHKIDPVLTPPFFSDESFIYYVVEPSRPDTKIKYNVKEYIDELLPVYFEILAEHSDLTMNDLEKGGWALKMYDIYRIDKLLNVKPDFDVDDEDLKMYKHIKQEEEKKEDEEVEEEGPSKKKRKV
jgi:hypothetical protein